MSDLGFMVIPKGAAMSLVFNTQAEAEAQAEEWLSSRFQYSVLVCEIKTRGENKPLRPIRKQRIVWERADGVQAGTTIGCTTIGGTPLPKNTVLLEQPFFDADRDYQAVLLRIWISDLNRYYAQLMKTGLKIKEELE